MMIVISHSFAVASVRMKVKWLATVATSQETCRYVVSFFAETAGRIQFNKLLIVVKWGRVSAESAMNTTFSSQAWAIRRELMMPRE